MLVLKIFGGAVLAGWLGLESSMRSGGAVIAVVVKGNSPIDEVLMLDCCGLLMPSLGSSGSLSQESSEL